MNIQATFSPNRQRWLKKPILATNYHRWLVDNGSLTRRLQQRYADFSVQAVMIKSAKPNMDEQACLCLTRHQHSWVRDVMLWGNGQGVVFAHSVLPKASLRGAWAGLSRLGSKPLGAMLFANPKVQRTALSYKKISANHALYRQAIAKLTKAPPYLWARRSMFSIRGANQIGQRIMVTEVFLPHLLESSSVT